MGGIQRQVLSRLRQGLSVLWLVAACSVPNEKKMTSQDWVEKLGMQKHPEGGFYKETYRSAGRLAADALPGDFGGGRSHGTGI